MSHVVESVAVAAPRGLVWRVIQDIATDAADTYVEIVHEARELTWTSRVFVEQDGAAEHRVDMSWWVRLSPSWTGTDVEHGCTFPEHPDLIGPIRARVVATLADVKSRAESQ